MLLETPEASRNQIQFAPEATIINYYNVKSLLGGHQDNLELALDKPVVSLSMGLSSIFLLGGKSKEEEPVIPILVRKGDIMCLGGDARLNFHSMARLLPHTVSLPTIDQTLCPSKEEQLSRASIAALFPQQQHEDDLDISSDSRLALEEYLSDHRININVRQVYPD
jgi:alkylated DNA repair protein alkB family protein 1